MVCMMSEDGILKHMGKIKRVGQSWHKDFGMDWKRGVHWMGKLIIYIKRKRCTAGYSLKVECYSLFGRNHFQLTLFRILCVDHIVTQSFRVCLYLFPMTFSKYLKGMMEKGG